MSDRADHQRFRKGKRRHAWFQGVRCVQNEPTLEKFQTVKCDWLRLLLMEKYFLKTNMLQPTNLTESQGLLLRRFGICIAIKPEAIDL